MPTTRGHSDLSEPRIWSVSEPHIETLNGRTRISQSVGINRTLWFEIPAEYESFVSDRSDFAAIALLPAAMIAGVDLHIDYRLTDTVLFNLKELVQPLIRTVYTEWSNVQVSATSNPTASATGSGVLCGFSAGVDSLSALQGHFYRRSLPVSLRITHLSNHNVGSYRSVGRAGWSARQKSLSHVANRIGLPLVEIDSNLEEFYPDEMLFRHVHTMCNGAIAHLLSGGIGTFLYPSGFSYEQILGGSTVAQKDMARLDAILLPLLSSSAVQLISVDPEKSRVDKTTDVIASELSQDLDVCTSDNPDRIANCSQCQKCLRTLLTIEIAGSLDRFLGTRFLAAPYRARRIAFMSMTLNAKRDAISLEIVAFARDRGFRWPVSAQLLRPFMPTFLCLRRQLRDRTRAWRRIS